MGKKNLIQIMAEKAAAVGTIVHEMSSVSQAVEYAADLGKGENLKTIACPGLAPEDRDMLQNLCEASGMALLE